MHSEIPVPDRAQINAFWLSGTFDRMVVFEQIMYLLPIHRLHEL